MRRTILILILVMLGSLTVGRELAASDAFVVRTSVRFQDTTPTPTWSPTPVPTPTQSAYNRVYLSVEPLGPARQQFPADASGVYRGGLTINFYFSSNKPIEVLIQTRDRSGNPIQDHYLSS
jgi:hypothetical protein